MQPIHKSTNYDHVFHFQDTDMVETPNTQTLCESCNEPRSCCLLIINRGISSHCDNCVSQITHHRIIPYTSQHAHIEICVKDTTEEVKFVSFLGGIKSITRSKLVALANSFKPSKMDCMCFTKYVRFGIYLSEQPHEKVQDVNSRIYWCKDISELVQSLTQARRSGNDDLCTSLLWIENPSFS